jgi:predicted transcriptional regulator
MTEDLKKLTTEVVSAYLRGGEAVAPQQLPALIETVYHALANAGAAPIVTPDDLKPAVPVKKSVTPDYIICLEDGKKLKMLKRHLRTAYNMSPEDYRTKWGLPADYPMTAPSYTALRSQFAKNIGLGLKPRKRAPAKKKA